MDASIEEYYRTLIEQMREEFLGLSVDMSALYQFVVERMKKSPKTGLSSLYALELASQDCLSGDGDYPEEIHVLFGDISGFKNINDKYQHRVGDEVLNAVGARLKAAIVDRDLAKVFHVSGDEFVLIVSREKYSQCVSKLDRAVREYVCPTSAGPVPVSLTFGSARVIDRDIPAACRKADAACQMAKAMKRFIGAECVDEGDELVERRFRCGTCRLNGSLSLIRKKGQMEGEQLSCPVCKTPVDALSVS